MTACTWRTTGPEIPEDQREAVFEPGSSSADDGTGFGLAIVERIAEAHGWDATVTEGIDGGARFEIRDIEMYPKPPPTVRSPDGRTRLEYGPSDAGATV